MIIDSLTHVTRDGRWFHTSHDASLGRLLREMDLAQVDRAVVVGLPDHIDNKFVLDVCMRHPDRLIPGGGFNPAAFTSVEGAARGIEKLLVEAPYPVIKLHPRLNKFDPLDPRCLAALDSLSQRESPPLVMIDTLFHHRDASLRSPVVETVHRIVNHARSVKFVLLHGGGAWLLPLVQAVQDCSNALVDVSFTLCTYAGSSLDLDLRYLFARRDRKLVVGSDFPEFLPSEAQARFTLLTEGLDENKRSNLLGRNLQAFLQPEG